MPFFSTNESYLYHCHKNEAIHRDIKPKNILTDSRFRVKLADFGFAKVVRKRKTVNGVWGHRNIERLRFCWGMNMMRKWMRGVLGW